MVNGNKNDKSLLSGVGMDLFVAAARDDAEPFQREMGACVIDLCDEEGETLLHIASRVGACNVIRELLKNGAKVSRTDIYGDSPLHLAAARGYSSAVEALLAAGADPNLKNRSDNTPLHVAAEGGAPDVVKLLLQAGAAPSEKNIYGYTPSHLARRQGHLASLALIERSEIEARGTRMHR